MRVLVSRDPIIESTHEVHAVVVDLDGKRMAWGDGQRPTVARSGIKLVQGLPLVRTGAADRYQLSEDEVALGCASHSGEPGHVETVRAWLERIGLGEEALACGSALPMRDDDLAAHHRAGRGPEAACNNCSGKHAGFLTVARHLGVDHEGYLEPDHPVQQLVTEAIGELCRFDLGGQSPGRDGCGIPTWSVPLDDLAGAMARLGRPDTLESSWGEAARRIAAAVGPRPWWISGTGRHEVNVAEVATEPILLKGGAEGVYLASLPTRGLGVAVKAADGAARAAQVGVSAVLAHLGAVPAESVAQPIHNVAGRVVGSVTAELDEPDS